MKQLFQAVRQNKFYTVAILISVIFFLLFPQILWIQDHKYNPWLTVFDTIWFRSIASVVVGLTAGLVFISAILKASKNIPGMNDREALRKLFFCNLPFYSYIILPFHIEIGLIDLFNNTLIITAVIIFIVMMESIFLIPVTIRDFFKKINTLTLPLLFFILTILFFAPVQIFMTNPSEFYFNYKNLVFYLIILSSGVFIILSRLIILFSFDSKGFKKIVVFFFITGFSFWLQGNIMVWQYGFLDGHLIDWKSGWKNGMVDSAVWILLIFSAMIKPDFLYKHIKRTSIFFILVQLVAGSMLFAKQYHKEGNVKEPSFKRYTVDENKKFIFSKNTNVIILLIDEFQSDIFNEVLKSKPEYLEVFDGFTYFPDTLAASSFTALAVPPIFTGEYFDNTVHIDTYVESTYLSNSILKKLKDREFEVDAYPNVDNVETMLFDRRVISNIKKIDDPVQIIKELSYVYDVSLFRYLPHFLKKYVYNDANWLLYPAVKKFYLKKYLHIRNFPFDFNGDQILRSDNVKFINDLWTQSETIDKNCFKYYHINGLHLTLSTRENFEIVHWDFSRDNYIEVSKAVFRIIRWFLEELKRIHIYDNSLIIIMSDHGCGQSADLYVNPVKNRPDADIIYKKYSFNYYKSRGAALLMVKPFNARGKLNTSELAASTTDIPLTIASELNIKADFPGIDVLNGDKKSKRIRFFRGYEYESMCNGHGFADELIEYGVSGNCWDSDSWKKTGRIFKKKQPVN